MSSSLLPRSLSLFSSSLRRCFSSASSFSIPSSISAIRFYEFGAADKMKLETIATPSLKPTDILVKNESIGVNFIDIYHRRGLYPLPLPAQLGREGAGVVVAVGSSVRSLSVGDRVAFFAPNSYANYTAVPISRAARLPSSMSYDAAAAIFLQGLTCSYLTTDSFKIKKGDSVLIHAAAGATGQLLCQVAKLRGAKVIGTCSSHKESIVKAAGADTVVAYDRSSKEPLPNKQAKWIKSVMDATNGQGVDAVYDSIGADTFEGSLQVLKIRGTLVLFGQSSGKVSALDPLQLAKGSFFLTRPTLDHFVMTEKEMNERANDLWHLVNQGVKPTIEKIFPLDQVAEAHKIIEIGRNTGKLLLKP